MTMSVKRRDTLVGNLQASLKKVFNCVPIKETWTSGQIAHELTRKKLSIGTVSVVGCLNNLKKNKLVLEPSVGCFKQIECKTMAVKRKVQAIKELTQEQISNPLASLSKAILDLSDVKTNLEMALLDVEDYMEKAEIKVEKLTQLQNLLKSIGE